MRHAKPGDELADVALFEACRPRAGALRWPTASGATSGIATSSAAPDDGSSRGGHDPHPKNLDGVLGRTCGDHCSVSHGSAHLNRAFARFDVQRERSGLARDPFAALISWDREYGSAAEGQREILAPDGDLNVRFIEHVSRHGRYAIGVMVQPSLDCAAGADTTGATTIHEPRNGVGSGAGAVQRNSLFAGVSVAEGGLAATGRAGGGFPGGGGATAAPTGSTESSCSRPARRARPTSR